MFFAFEEPEPYNRFIYEQLDPSEDIKLLSQYRSRRQIASLACLVFIIIFTIGEFNYNFKSFDSQLLNFVSVFFPPRH